jgi:hypothetical protein
LKVKTADIAKFGQLYLQKGMWMGKRLLSEAWVAEASAKHSDNSNTQTNIDWTQGYGYQFWRCQHNLYRGDGAHGQYCIVMPEQDAVVAITAGVQDMQAALNVVWDELLPAIQPGVMAANPEAEQALKVKLSHLALAPAMGQAQSPLQAKLGGRQFRLEPNDRKLETVSFVFDDATRNCTVHLCDGRGEHAVVCGHGTWLQGISTLENNGAQPVAASWAWTSDATCVLKLCFVETPFTYTLTCQFIDNRLRLTMAPNIVSGPGAHPQVIWSGV